MELVDVSSHLPNLKRSPGLKTWKVTILSIKCFALVYILTVMNCSNQDLKPFPISLFFPEIFKFFKYTN